MKAKKKKVDEVPGWMVTMSDMNMLLLTFFVLLFSWMSLEVGPKQEKDVAVEVEQALSDKYEDKGTSKKEPQEQEGGLFSSRQKQSTELDKEMSSLLERVDKVEDEYIITLGMETGEFERGQWALNNEHKMIVNRIAEIMKTQGRKIIIKGFTDASILDSLVIEQGRLVKVTQEMAVDWERRREANHWILSYLRARAVMFHMVSQGMKPEQFVVRPMAYKSPYISDNENGEIKKRVVQIIVSSETF